GAEGGSPHKLVLTVAPAQRLEIVRRERRRAVRRRQEEDALRRPQLPPRRSIAAVQEDLLDSGATQHLADHGARERADRALLTERARVDGDEPLRACGPCHG